MRETGEKIEGKNPPPPPPPPPSPSPSSPCSPPSSLPHHLVRGKKHCSLIFCWTSDPSLIQLLLVQDRHITGMGTKTTMKGVLTPSKQTLITDYLPEKKKTSQRLAEKKKTHEVVEERTRCLTRHIDPTGFQVKKFPLKGRGVVSNKCIKQGAFVVEYQGDLISLREAKARERRYEKENYGSYMYYFEWKNRKYCLDATIEPKEKSLGRLINHSRRTPNCKTKVVELEGIPHLIFVALKDIEPGTELLYDYGETDRKAIEANPWLADT